MAFKSGKTPQQDTGWGVIFRLNDLFREIESFSTAGKYDSWNFKLDRIWSNLCYRHSLKVTEDKHTGKIVSIELDDEDIKIKYFIDQEILKSKGLMAQARKKKSDEQDLRNNTDWVRSKKDLYKNILLKEVWLRKYMSKLGLYLKEVEHNPAGAMFGK